MAEAIINLENVSKSFIASDSGCGLKNMMLRPDRYLRHLFSPEKYIVLQDIDFLVFKGESIGVVGANGSGKSTLLGLIGKVLQPSSGKITVHGSIGMLLELGAGFCYELTGRENIILNGVMLGGTQKGMRAKMDAIIDFSELRQHIDQPIRTYSSGMIVRLGFAIATALEPDILLIDEVLAVGDRDFKQKCKDKINKLTAQGTTLILVSHNLNDIREFCSRAVFLKDGRIVRNEKAECLCDILSGENI